MSLREKQFAKRRHQMLDAAESLIRQTGGTDFSMRILAELAEVSPATPYNFFGSKEGLLFALLQRTLEAFLSQGLVFTSEDPHEQALEAAENALNLLLGDPVVMRPLYQVMLALTDPLHHPLFIKGAFEFYRGATRGLLEEGLLKDASEQDTFAFSLMAHFIGVLNLWVQEDIGDEYFRAQVMLGFAQMLSSLGDSPPPTLVRRLEQLRRSLRSSKIKPALFSRSKNA